MTPDRPRWPAGCQRRRASAVGRSRASGPASSAASLRHGWRGAHADQTRASRRARVASQSARAFAVDVATCSETATEAYDGRPSARAARPRDDLATACTRQHRGRRRSGTARRPRAMPLHVRAGRGAEESRALPGATSCDAGISLTLPVPCQPVGRVQLATCVHRSARRWLDAADHDRPTGRGRSRGASALCETELIRQVCLRSVRPS